MNPFRKKKERKEAETQQSYERLFIKEPGIKARDGKMLYVHSDFHKTIRMICQVIGNHEITLSGYVHNVLSRHFEAYGDEIVRLYEKKNKGINIIKNSEK